MKPLKSVLLAGALAALLAGCTYPHPASEAESAPTDSSSSADPAVSAAPVTLEGKFQSQAAATSGLATIRVTQTGAVLEVKDLSTEPGEDLRLMLSPGTLSPDAKGEPALTSSTLIDLGPLGDDASQRIDMDPGRWSSMPSPVRSVVIYNYADRTAYGTANLTRLQP